MVPEGTSPFIPSVGVILNSVPLQEVVDIGEIIPSGFNVTNKVNAVPEQVPDEGVTI